MKRPDEERLLREILSDESVETLREASLARGLAALHARRRRRALVSGVVASTAVAALLALLSTHRPLASKVPSPTPAARTNPVKVINDEQLLALFPDRAVALVGPPGNQKLLFLDAPAPRENP